MLERGEDVGWNEQSTLRGQAASRLRDDILSGALQPGLVIKDAELARQLGISTIPVREALVQLASEGLVQMPPNRAKRVTPLSKRALVELHAVFLVLAMQAFEWGIPRVTPALLAHLDDLMARQKKAIAGEAWVEAVKASMEFNNVVYRAADNLELARLLGQMNTAFARVSILLRPTRDRQRNHLVYSRILAAMKQHKWREASRLYKAMLGELHGLLELLPEESVAESAALQRPVRNTVAGGVPSRRPRRKP